MNRKKVLAGNWKMNMHHQDAIDFFQQLKKTEFPVVVEVMLFPPSIYLTEAIHILSDKVKLGAQNCHTEDKGAFTGEISAAMLATIQCKAILVGHSERRMFFNETNDIIAQKVKRVLESALTLVLCCGETAEQRADGMHFSTIERQLRSAIADIKPEKINQLIIAYEPVWAIGTGQNASPEQAQEMHAYIRRMLAEMLGDEHAENIPILYGGSCKPDNAKGIFSQPDIDGGLIGGASLQLSDFISLIKALA